MDTTALGHGTAGDGLSIPRRFFARGGGYMLPGAIFLGIPVYYAVMGPHPRLWLVILLSLVVAGGYLGTPLVVNRSLTFRVGWLVGIAAAISLLAWVYGRAAIPAYDSAYFLVPLVMLLPWSVSTWILAVLGTALLGLSAIQADPLAATLAITGGVLAAIVGTGMRQEKLNAKLAAAEERNAMLAVAAERERIGRDLHDILGHSLTAITVKAQLARQLLALDPEGAAHQLADLETVSRQALADVRATVSGMREVRLASELASARTVLEAAGMVCEAPSSVPPLTDQRSELFGFALREAVTNVVRHSGATRCRIELTEEGMTVSDDGNGMTGAEGSGLAGLRERLALQGFRLQVSSSKAGTELSVVDRGEAER